METSPIYYINDICLAYEVVGGVRIIWDDESRYAFGEFIAQRDFCYDEFDAMTGPVVDFSNANPYYHREITEELYLARNASKCSLS